MNYFLHFTLPYLSVYLPYVSFIPYFCLLVFGILVTLVAWFCFRLFSRLALQNVNKDYTIFLYFRNFVAKSDQKRKMGWTKHLSQKCYILLLFFSKPKKKTTTKKIAKNKMTSAMSLKVPGIEYIERILSTWTTMKLKSWKRGTSPWSLSYPWTG